MRHCLEWIGSTNLIETRYGSEKFLQYVVEEYNLTYYVMTPI